MTKRPLCFICLLFISILYVMNLTGFSRMWENPVSFQNRKWIDNQKTCIVLGMVSENSMKDDLQILTVKKAFLLKIMEDTEKKEESGEKEKISLRNIRVLLKQTQAVLPGSHILLQGKLQKIKTPGNPGEFDSEKYYACQHIYYQMEDVSILKQTEAYGIEWLIYRAYRSLQTIIYDCAGTNAPFFEALLLGKKENLEYETKRMFQQAGIVHILTISGLHISLFGKGLFKGCMQTGMGLFPSAFLSFFIMLFYGKLTGSGAATIRAVVMFILEVGGSVSGRSYDLPTAMSISAVLLVLNNPAWLYNSSFILSFLAMAALSIVYPILKKFVVKKHRGIDMIIMSTSIQVTMLPALAYFYGEISWAGIFLNLLVLPSVSFVLISGIGMLVIGSFWKLGGMIASEPGGMLLSLYRWLCQWISKLPFTSIVTGCPPMWKIGVYYSAEIVLLIVCFIYTRIKHEREGLKLKEEAGWQFRLPCINIIALLLVVLLITSMEKKNLEIYCLDVGQGDSIAFYVPDGGWYLSDCGSTSRNLVGRYVLEPFLRYQGISYLNGIFLSHMDADHVNGIEELLSDMQQHLITLDIGALYLSENEYASLKRKNAYFITLAEELKIPVRLLSAGDHLRISKVDLTVISPEAKVSLMDENENSLVYELNYGDFSALFTGDIGEETEMQILEKIGGIDFLKVAHHGSRYSSSEAFLEKTHPTLGVISCSENNRYGHPGKETITRLENEKCQIFFTMYQGAVMLKTDGTEIGVKTYRRENLG